jgi:hypothetical protein
MSLERERVTDRTEESPEPGLRHGDVAGAMIAVIWTPDGQAGRNKRGMSVRPESRSEGRQLDTT